MEATKTKHDPQSSWLLRSASRLQWFPAYPLTAVLIVIGAVLLFDRWTIGAVVLATGLVVA